MEEDKYFEVWSEGYACTGDHGEAQYLGRYKADTFVEACKKAIEYKDWDPKHYDEKTNSYWACKFYDNEREARVGFG